MGEKITREMVEQYLELHEKIGDRLEEVLEGLLRVNPKQYSAIDFGYYAPDIDYFGICDYTNSFGFESERIPTRYLYEDDYLEQEKQTVKKREERENRK